MDLVEAAQMVQLPDGRKLDADRLQSNPRSWQYSEYRYLQGEQSKASLVECHKKLRTLSNTFKCRHNSRPADHGAQKRFRCTFVRPHRWIFQHADIRSSS